MKTKIDMAYTKMNSKERPQFGDDELEVLLRELRRVLESDTIGDVVELGCFKGETSVHIARFIRRLSPYRRLYLYDSFAGLPEKTRQDESPAGTQFMAGELPATKREVEQRLAKAGFTGLTIKKAWFRDLTPADLPEQIGFAFLDGDFYESIMDSLRLVWPKLTKGSVVVIDDYINEALPGAAKAVDEWLADHPAEFRVERSLGIMRL